MIERSKFNLASTLPSRNLSELSCQCLFRMAAVMSSVVSVLVLGTKEFIKMSEVIYSYFYFSCFYSIKFITRFKEKLTDPLLLVVLRNHSNKDQIEIM